MNEESVFQQAISITSPEERRAYLDRVCGDNAELRARVDGLLRSDELAGSFLDRPAPEFDRTVNVSRDAMEAGLAPAFGADAAVVIGEAGHSVLKSLSKHLPKVPHVTLRDSQEERGAIVQPGSPELPQSQDDSRYQLLGEIARGGMGAIIKGRDTDLGRDLAIKVLLDSHKSNPDVIQRFVEEAQIGGQLQHPGIVPVYELGQFNDQRPFFSMKLVKGETLASLLSARADVTEDRGRFLGIFEQICQTMAYAHSRSVIHRDLKPANIMVGAFGEVQVMDWGLAKVISTGGIADEQLSQRRHTEQSVIHTRRSTGSSDAKGSRSAGSQTRMGSVMGTPAYMPPEQARGEVDSLNERADVFGLGAILCEILTGAPPYTAGNSDEVLRLALHGKLDDCFQRLDDCAADTDLVQLVRDCLHVEPTNRPAKAEVLAERFTDYLQSVEERLREAELDRVAQTARVAEERKRRKVTMALAASLIVLISVGSAAWIHNERRNYEFERRRMARQTAAEKVVRDNINAANNLLANVRANKTDEPNLANREAMLSGLLVEVDKALINAEQAVEAAEQEDVGERLRTDAGAKLAVLLEAKRAYGAELKQVSSRRAFRDELDDIRLSVATLGAEDLIRGSDYFNYGAAVKRYAAAFRNFGLDVFSLDPSEFEENVEASLLQEEIVAALDRWAHAISQLTPAAGDDWNSESGLLSRLDSVLGAADRLDRNPWRRSLRFPLSEFARSSISGQDGQIGRQHQISLLRDLALSDNARQQSPELIAWFGAILRGLGETETAVKVLRTAQQDHPADFWLNFELAVNLRAMGESAQAIEFLRVALAVRPDSLQVLSNLSTTLHALGRVDESIRFRQEFLMRLPTDAESREAFSRIGLQMKREGRFQAAFEVQRSYCRAFPNDFRGHFLLARFLFSTPGNYEEQLNAIKRVADLQPADGPSLAWLAHSVAGSLTGAGRHKQALEAYEVALRLDPNDDQSAMEKILGIYFETGQSQTAVSAAGDWIADQPSDVGRWSSLALALVHSGDQSAYLAHCNSMLDQFSDETDPAKASVVCLACSLLPDLVDTNRLPTGPLKKFVDDATAEPQQLARALNTLGLTALRSGDVDQALEYAKRAAQLESPVLTQVMNHTIGSLIKVHLDEQSKALVDLAKGDVAIQYLQIQQNEPIHSLVLEILMEEAKSSFLSPVALGRDEDELMKPNAVGMVEITPEAWDAVGSYAIELSKGLPDDLGFNSQRSRFLQRIAGNDSLFESMREAADGASEIWAARGRALALRSQWPDAASAYAQLPYKVDEPALLFELACALRMAGDDEAYRRLVTRFSDQFDKEAAGEAGMYFARTIGLAPQDKVVALQAVELAKLAVDASPTAWRVHSLGLAQLRAGDLNGALLTLESSLNMGWGSAQNHAALVMVHAALKDSVQANQYMQFAKESLQQQRADANDGVVKTLVIDWLAFNALKREAENALSGKQD